MDFKEALDSMVQQIISIVKDLIEKASFDKTYKGVIQSVEEKGNSYSYAVLINGRNRELKSSIQYAVGDYVYVLVPRSNWQEAVLCGAVVKVPSHIGMIVQSTTLDTEAKVKAIYGGESWGKIEGRFLLGADEDYYFNGRTGGETTHQHKYGLRTGGFYKDTVFAEDSASGLFDYSDESNYTLSGYTNAASADINVNNGSESTSKSISSVSHYNYTAKVSTASNMPPYKAVYIWERTA